MNIHSVNTSPAYEFSFPRVDTLARVEPDPHHVVIRLSRDTLSSMQKDYFVRELASEGFIPDDYAWRAAQRIEWCVDASWLLPQHRALQRPRRLVLGSLVAAVVLWVGLLVAAYRHDLTRSRPPHPSPPSASMFSR